MTHGIASHPRRRGAPWLLLPALALVVALVRSDTASGLTLKFLLSKLVYSTSDGAILFLLGFSALALVCSRLALSRRVHSGAAALLASGLLLGYGTHLAATVAYHLAHDIGFSAHVYQWSQGVNSYTAFLHSHLGKAAMAPLNGLLTATSNYDAGGAWAKALPLWQLAGIGLGFLLATVGALLRMPGFMRAYGQRPALVLVYLVGTATALKCIFDGGVLAYAVPPSLLLVGTFAGCADPAAWSHYWLRRGWVLAVLVLGSYVALWIGLATDEVPLVGAWLFLVVALAVLMTSAWRGPAAWVCRVALLSYLVLNTSLDASDNLVPLLAEVGPRHRAAVFDATGKAQTQLIDRWRGQRVFQLYRALGDDPWKPRRSLVWEAPAQGLRRMQASVRLIDMDQPRGQLLPTPSLRVSRIALARNDWIDLEFQDVAADLPPILLLGSASALSRNNYYVWLYQIDVLLRGAGWNRYVLMPRTQGNTRAD